MSHDNTQPPMSPAQLSRRVELVDREASGRRLRRQYYQVEWGYGPHVIRRRVTLLEARMFRGGKDRLFESLDRLAFSEFQAMYP